MLGSDMANIDIPVSQENALELIMPADYINPYHTFVKGFPTGALVHPVGSERQKKIAAFAR